MNSKTFVLPFISLMIVLLALSFASAAALEITSLSYPTTANHDSQITATFNVVYSGNLAETTINFTGTTNIGTWQLPSPIVVQNDSVAHPLSATLTIPAHSSGTISASLKADSLNPTEEDTEALSIPIIPAPSLDVIDAQQLTKTQNGIITITNTGNTILSSINLSASGDFNISFSQNNIALNPGAVSSAITITPSPSVNLSDLGLGKHEVTITAKDLSQTAATDAITYSVVSSEFCEEGNINTSKISITNLEDTSSDDEWE